MAEIEANDGNLSDQQVEFCYQYVACLNPSISFLRAGYTTEPHHVASRASALLRGKKVKRFIAKLREERQEELMINALDVISQVQNFAFSNLTDFMDPETGEFYENLTQLPRSMTSALAEVTQITTEHKGVTQKRTKIKLVDSLKSNEVLLRHLGELKDIYLIQTLSEDDINRRLVQLDDQIDQIKHNKQEEPPIKH